MAAHREDLIDAEIRDPAAALVADPVVAALNVARNELVPPGDVGIDAEHAEALRVATVGVGAISPHTQCIVVAIEGAVDEVQLRAASAVLPGATQQSRVGG